MAKQVKRRRGSTAEHDVFIGAEGEVTVDTDIQTLVVHDGLLAGGYPLAKADLSNADLANKINVAELATTDGAAGHILTTDGNGQISFDVPGGVSPNSVGALELNTSDGLAGTVLTTDGGGTLTFASVSVGVDELECIDGTAGQVLTTDGNATISFTTIDVDGAVVGGDLTGTVANAQIAADAVGNTELANDSVTTDKITDANVTTDKITDANVTSIKLSTDSVTTDKIVDANVTDVKISGMSASKLTGALPILDGSALTGIVTIPSGVIAMWSGAIVAIPSGWVICDGTNSTPDLRDRFVIGAGTTHAVDDTGGSTSTAGATLSIAQLAAHTHTYSNNPATSEGGDNASQSALQSTATTGSTGGGATHTHTGTLPPYYALAYIMKS